MISWTVMFELSKSESHAIAPVVFDGAETFVAFVCVAFVMLPAVALVMLPAVALPAVALLASETFPAPTPAEALPAVTLAPAPPVVAFAPVEMFLPPVVLAPRLMPYRTLRVALEEALASADMLPALALAPTEALPSVALPVMLPAAPPIEALPIEALPIDALPIEAFPAVALASLVPFNLARMGTPPAARKLL